MLNAQEFLNEMFDKTPDLDNYYLYKMTESVDKTFIIDLNKVQITLLEPYIIKNEITNFLEFIIKSENTKNLHLNFFDYLRYDKNDYFIRQKIWDFLYSLEILKFNSEEIFVFVNILNFSIYKIEILKKFFLWRKIILDFSKENDVVFLDEVFLSYNDLKNILNKIFENKAIKKIRLFKNLGDIKGSTILSRLIRDYIAQEKILKKQNLNKKKIKKKENAKKENIIKKKKNLFQ